MAVDVMFKAFNFSVSHVTAPAMLVILQTRTSAPSITRFKPLSIPRGWKLSLPSLMKGKSAVPSAGPQQNHEQNNEEPNCQKKKKLKMNPPEDSEVDNHGHRM